MARAFRRLEQRLDRLLARGEVGCEASLVAHGCRKAALVEERTESVEGLGADPQRLGEGLGTRGDEHELLEVDRVLCVGAAVDHVHQRHRQRPRFVAAEEPVQRHAGFRRGRLRRRERDAEDRVRAEPLLVRRPVQLDQPLVQRTLVGHVQPPHRGRDLTVDVLDRPRDAFAAPSLALVAQLERLVDARRRPGRDSRATQSSRVQAHIDLDRRVAARVEDPAAVHLGDSHQCRASLARS